MTRCDISLRKRVLSRTELPALPPSPRNLPPCPQHHPPPHLPSCPRRKITLLPPGATTRLGSGSGPSHLLKDFSPPGALPPLRDQVPPLRGCLRVTKTFPDSVPPPRTSPFAVHLGRKAARRSPCYHPSLPPPPHSRLNGLSTPPKPTCTWPRRTVASQS